LPAAEVVSAYGIIRADCSFYLLIAAPGLLILVLADYFFLHFVSLESMLLEFTSKFYHPLKFGTCSVGKEMQSLDFVLVLL